MIEVWKDFLCTVGIDKENKKIYTFSVSYKGKAVFTKIIDHTESCKATYERDKASGDLYSLERHLGSTYYMYMTGEREEIFLAKKIAELNAPEEMLQFSK